MYKKVIKRIFDIFFAIILLLMACIPMIFIAVMIKLTSRGPILFQQQRYGIHKKIFILYKFRSMAEGTPELANQDFSDMDSYVTSFGNIMRRTSIYELPQLLNILKGDMSFIGPRPMANSDYRVVLLRQERGANDIVPGITGLAQINGRNLISDEQKATYDAIYAKEVSLKMDLAIVVRTVLNVFFQIGINSDEKKN